MALANCWEIKKCGREKGGPNVPDLGECIVSKDAMGHSCWAVAGTLCGGEVQGTAAQKEKNCMLCEVQRQRASSPAIPGRAGQIPRPDARPGCNTRRHMTSS
jgi:hypothetical protein